MRMWLSHLEILIELRSNMHGYKRHKGVNVRASKVYIIQESSAASACSESPVLSSRSLRLDGRVWIFHFHFIFCET